MRDACDLGFLVTVAEDACGTKRAERHKRSLEIYKGYCRIASTDQVTAELASLSQEISQAE